jgi:hypothetical protein
MLVTGTFRSSISGERVHIDPDGSLRFYPPSGTNFSQITNRAGEAVWRGPLDGSQRSGRINVNILGVGINFSNETDVPFNLRSEFVLLDRRMRMTAPFIALEIDERFSNPAGGSHRVQFSAMDSDGDPYSLAFLSYQLSQGSNSNRPALVGNTVGLVFMGGGGQDARLEVRHATSGWGSYLNVHANSLVPSSSGTVKEDIEDIRAVIDPLETIRAARAKKFIHLQAPTREPRVGLIAEELPEILVNRDADVPGIDLVQVTGTLWGAFNQVLDQQIVSTSGTAVVLRNQFPVGGIWAPGVSVEVPVTWESTPPAAPTGGFVQVHSAFIWSGKITGWIKTGSTTETGCVVVFKNISSSNVVVNEGVDNLRVSATAIGLGLFTPPYIPPEEA